MSGLVGQAGALDGKVVLVTGSAERVGRVLAQRIAEAGATVAVNHFGQAELAEETVSLISGADGRAFVVEADVSDPEAAPGLVADVVARRGGFDVLVHNASNFVGGPFLDVTPSDFDRSFGINLRGPFFLSQAAARAMQAQGSGRIIAIAGDSWFEAWPNYVAHGVSKSGLVRLMQYLAVTLSPSVQCNVICPAKIMPTDDASNAQLSSGRGQGTFEGLLELAPDVHIRRGGAEEVAEMIIHLAQCTPYLSGAVIPLDGGKSVF